MNRLIFACVLDEKTENRFMGHVYDLKLEGDQRLLTVYGDSWESMRELKHYLTQAVKEYYATSQEGGQQ